MNDEHEREHRSELTQQEDDDLNEAAGADEDERTRRVAATVLRIVEQRISFHRGPLPDPATMREYEGILPGAADRIVAMAERQASHRQTIETHAVTSEFANQRWGTTVGGAVAAAGLVAAGAAAVWGNPLVGLALGVGDIGAIVFAYVFGIRQRQSEREAKAQIMAGLDETEAPSSRDHNHPLPNRESSDGE